MSCSNRTPYSADFFQLLLFLPVFRPACHPSRVSRHFTCAQSTIGLSVSSSDLPLPVCLCLCSLPHLPLASPFLLSLRQCVCSIRSRHLLWAPEIVILDKHHHHHHRQQQPWSAGSTACALTRHFRWPFRSWAMRWANTRATLCSSPSSSPAFSPLACKGYATKMIQSTSSRPQMVGPSMSDPSSTTTSQSTIRPISTSVVSPTKVALVD